MKRLFFWIMFFCFQIYAGICIQEDLTQLLTDRDITYMTFKINASCQAIAIWSVDVSDVKNLQAAYFDGQSWTIPGINEFISDSGDAEFPDVALNNAGRVVVIWKANMKARVSCFSFDDVLSGWSMPMDIGDARQEGDENDFFRIGLDEEGLAIAAWPDFDSAGFVLSSRSSDCISWSAPEKLSGDSVQTMHPFLSVSKKGRAVVVWRSVGLLDAGFGNIQFAYFRNGNWDVLNGDIISVPLIDYKSPFVSINERNNALVSWVKDNLNTEVVQALFLDEELRKSQITTLSPNIEANLIQVQRAQLNNGDNALVVWSLANELELANRNVQYAFYDGAWHTPEENSSFIVGMGYGPHLCYNDVGEGAILYIATFPDSPQEQLALSLFNRSTRMWFAPQIFFNITPSETENGLFYSLGCALSSNNNMGGFISRNFFIEDAAQDPPEENAEFIISSVCCGTKAIGTPSPPTELIGILAANRFAMDSENFVKLHWCLSSDGDIYTQRVYRDDVLIASIPAVQAMFVDHNLAKPLPSTYAVTAVNNGGLESAPVQVHVTT